MLIIQVVESCPRDNEDGLLMGTDDVRILSQTRLGRILGLVKMHENCSCCFVDKDVNWFMIVTTEKSHALTTQIILNNTVVSLFIISWKINKMAVTRLQTNRQPNRIISFIKSEEHRLF